MLRDEVPNIYITGNVFFVIKLMTMGKKKSICMYMYIYTVYMNYYRTLLRSLRFAIPLLSTGGSFFIFVQFPVEESTDDTAATTNNCLALQKEMPS